VSAEPRTRPAPALAGLLAACLALTACASAATVVAADALPEQGDAAADVDERVMAAQGDLGFDLLAESMAEDDGNVVLSPLSIATALAMTWNGTAGSTAEEFASVMGLEDVPLADVNVAYADLLARLADTPDDVELTVANSLWGDDDFTFEDGFLETNADYYGAGLRTVDFDDAEAAGDAIGDWLSDVTEGRIEETPAGVTPEDVMHLINALYFLADWQNTFDPDYTMEVPFTLEDGTEVDVEMLNEEREVEVLFGDDIALARLPYVGGEQAAYVALPPEGTRLADFVAGLDTETLDGWVTELEPVELTFQMPKLEIEYEASLTGALEALGMTEAFMSGDFSPMTPAEDLAITEVGHATYLRVDEAGTEAAAATDVVVGEMAEAPPPDEFIVDRPYVFLLRDEGTGALVIAAAIVDPRE
jgi:serpin B